MAHALPHYGLKKLSIGVASVLLSTTLYAGVTAQADTATQSLSGSSSPQTTSPATNQTAEKQAVTRKILIPCWTITIVFLLLASYHKRGVKGGLKLSFCGGLKMYDLG
ncbi:YSIRK-type signal peptide-containing protein, partial [Limosilactobacillus ingluviei]|uniref:YSIRK-type signal peptide-containing protein n=1 Tax=Limosilactobacillus ingluviei TaxID=148604 RepID=UPI00128EF64C